ncbi:structural protein [Pararheinheimera phage vB_PsoM_KLER1-1]|nr:structural protein [Pararheinheimera phage vB_PsoM_KLER1-1]
MARTYTTMQGDTWDLIAFKVYQSEQQMNTLIEANQAYRNVVFFSANIVLTVPDVTVTVTAELPPWRR